MATKAERVSKRKDNRLARALALTGDVKEAAYLVGISCHMAFRRLEPGKDAYDAYQRILQAESGKYLGFPPDERRALLAYMLKNNARPVIHQGPEGERSVGHVLLESGEWMKAFDMLNKMDGVYVEKRELTGPQGSGVKIVVDTGVPRAPGDVIDVTPKEPSDDPFA